MRLLITCAVAFCLAACAAPPKPRHQPVAGADESLTPVQAYRRGMQARDANDFKTAYKCMLSAAQRGHAEAQFELGLWYMTGNRGVPVDFEKAAQWVEKAAEQGQRDALTYIWQLYFFGKGVPQSDARAYVWLQRSAGTGDPEASYRLGLFYYEGISTPQDHAQAAVWFQDAAKHDVPGACYYLGVMHLHGDGVKQSDELALKWFKKGADADHPASLLAMGDLYRDGRGVDKDAKKAEQWYRKALAQTDDPDVQTAAGVRLKQLQAGEKPH
jgi:hypothetical protein